MLVSTDTFGECPDGPLFSIPLRTVKTYTRHNSHCPKRAEKNSKSCNCPKWIYENDNGGDRRFSAKTRSWADPAGD